MPSAQTDLQIRNRLATHEVRYTAGRRAVVAALALNEGPRSAAELADDLNRAIPLSSLYRSLAVMSDAGVLAPHFGAKGVTRYELAEWIVGHHHHLVCSECGSVDDLQLPSDLEATLETLIAAAALDGDFTATGHTLEIEGRCAASA